MMRFRLSASAVAIVLSTALVCAALPAADTFDRANENPLANGWLTPGGVDSMEIVSNVATGKAGANYSYSYWDTDVPSNDQYSEATIAGTSLAALASLHGGVAVRGSTSALTAYFFGDVAGAYKILYVTAGSATTLATCSGTPTAGDVLRLSVTSTTLTATVGGAGPGGSPCTATDSSLASGRLAIFGYSALSQLTLNNWSGDTVGGAATPGCKNWLLLLGAGCDEWLK